MRAALPLAMLMSLGLSGCGLSTGSEPPGDTRHPGSGWTRDPAEPVYGETATSEAFTLTALDMTVPTGLQVAGVGRRVSQISGSTPGTTVHRFQADAVRDATVSVGRYQISETGVNGVRVHLAVPSSGTKTAAAEWTAVLSTSIDKLVGTFGPFPYADLWATVVPGHSGGWEFPGALQPGDRAGPAVLVAHELAHQYFHGLVGNNQAVDPWLDESFATLGEAVVLGEKYAYRLPDIRPELRGQLGRPMSHWARHGGRPPYNEAVYQQGGAVLTELRAESAWSHRRGAKVRRPRCARIRRRSGSRPPRRPSGGAG